MTPNERPSVALVLGSGGVLGASFHAGVLMALKDVWRIDGRFVDEIVGTSAGALTAGLLGAGITPADLVRREQGVALSPHGQRIMTRRGKTTGRSAQQPVAGFGVAAAPEVVWSALRTPGAVMPGSVLAGLAPRGRNSTDRIALLLDGVLQSRWPVSPNLRICTVALSTGRRRVFESNGPATPGMAAAASCAVPAVHRPVTIDGDEYVDGAVHSANNLDSVRGVHDLVIISSPMSSSEDAATLDPWAMARTAAATQTALERARLRGNPRIVVIQPDSAHVEGVGPDVMRADRRAAVVMSAHDLASAQLRAAEPPDFNRDAPPAKEPRSTED